MLNYLLRMALGVGVGHIGGCTSMYAYISYAYIRIYVTWRPYCHVYTIIQEISQEEVETTTSDANKVTREQSGQSHAYSDSSYSGRPS